LTPVADDGIVVIEVNRMTTDEYLYDTEETNRNSELAMGVVREP